MEKSERLSTDELLRKAAAGQQIHIEAFTDLKEEKAKLREEIERQFPSVNQFCDHCYMQHSHLCAFFNGEKKIGRNRMLAMLIVLGYDILEIRSFLDCFQAGTLYIKNERDYIIIQALCEADLKGLKHRQRLDHVESKLLERKKQALIEDKSRKS